MPIPETQLETWSKQGSVTQSASTYAVIKNALESPNAIYKDKHFEVFLQGSYGNHTNVYAESDVDVTIRLNSIMRSDLKLLSPQEQAAYHNAYATATYNFEDFKKAVIVRLENAFGKDNVVLGKKAINIKANESRRSADVVVCYQYRRYYHWPVDYQTNGYIPGIIFPTTSYGEIINYPKEHSKNCTTKHQETGNNFKPLVRIFKNIRTKLVEDRVIDKNLAPSYFIEGLIYNVPKELFVGSYGNMVANILNWFNDLTDRTKLVCANNQYYLLVENDSVCWSPQSAKIFIDAVIKLWNNW